MPGGLLTVLVDCGDDSQFRMHSGALFITQNVVVLLLLLHQLGGILPGNFGLKIYGARLEDLRAICRFSYPLIQLDEASEYEILGKRYIESL